MKFWHRDDVRFSINTISLGVMIICLVFTYIEDSPNVSTILSFLQVILGYISLIVTGLALYLAYHFTVQQAKLNADLLETNELYTTADNMEKTIASNKRLPKEKIEELTKIAANLRSRARVAKQGFIYGYRNIDKL